MDDFVEVCLCRRWRLSDDAVRVGFQGKHHRRQQ